MRRFIYLWSTILLIYHLPACAINLDKLAGICTNQYNIRNDILIYINSSVPNFTSVWRSIIKIASNKQFLYYKAETYEEAHQAVTENSIHMRCLSKQYKNNEEYIILQEIETRMGDTEERRKHILEVSSKFFGRHGFERIKISKKELDEICERGDHE